jgi:hypothetical protein
LLATSLMQLVLPQSGPGRTVTVKELVLVLPHWSNAVTFTVVEELTGKHVPGGGLNISVGAAPGQQLSTANALYGTGVQGLQVCATMFEAEMLMQLVGAQLGS